jgi:hypothetical protein
MKRSAAHRNTATHAHYHPLPLTAITEQHTSTHIHTRTSKHTAPQLQKPRHCKSNKPHARQHGGTVTHNGGAALHTHPRPQAAAPCTATPHWHTQHFQHGVAVAVGSHTTAVRHCDCDLQDHRTHVALVRNMDCQRSPPPPPTTHATQHHTPTATRR